jgi:hypothetical protein
MPPSTSSHGAFQAPPPPPELGFGVTSRLTDATGELPPESEQDSE